MEKIDFPQFSTQELALIKSTRIRVGRNLRGFPLGPGISKDQRKEVEAKVVSSLTSLEGEMAGKYFSLEKMNEKT